MVEKLLVEFSYNIDEEIVKEDDGFVQKIMSNDENIVKAVEKASKTLEKDLNKIDAAKMETADEKLKPLIEVFMKNKDKITYSYDAFDNGVIRIFETKDEDIAKQLQSASDTLHTTEKELAKSQTDAAGKPAKEEEEKIEEWDPEKERAEAEAEKIQEQVLKDVENIKEEVANEDPYLHVDTISDYILKSEKHTLVFYVNPNKEESKELIDKIPKYAKKFTKINVKAVNVSESAELDAILKIPALETPIAVLYDKQEDQIIELARLASSEITEENIEKMANVK